jgi:3-hydroxyisobutyrate dehydrogenase-like beta-hydroxyacid dehydrogenase
MKEDIGLIGIGLVGTALAENLLKAGFGVVGRDVDPARNRHLESLGGAVAPSPRAVAERCRRVFLALMTTDVVRAVTEGADGLMAAAQPPSFIVDTTTGSPEDAEALAGRLAARGTTYLDATISGSSAQIRDRAGVFMVGGTADAFAACRDLLDAVADRAVHVGPTGSGARAKLATNLVLGLNRLALCEGLAFAESLGPDGAAFLELVRATPAYSRAVDIKGEKLLKRDYAAQSKLSQHLKDVRLIRAYAERAGQELPLARVHEEIMEALVQRGDGDQDTCMVVEEIRRRRTTA